MYTLKPSFLLALDCPEVITNTSDLGVLDQNHFYWQFIKLPQK